MKQWGFYDKNALPSVFNILSTYKTPFGIPYRITKIDSEIFKDCDKLQTVVIPDTITEIGDSAFENCRSLEKIYIPDSVTKIKQEHILETAKYYIYKNFNNSSPYIRFDIIEIFIKDSSFKINHIKQFM